MLRPGSFALTLLLAMLIGLGPLSVDMYLASLPDISRLLHAPASQVQLTISVYLVGLACAQIVFGPLSDRHGRRPVVISALGVYMLASLVCSLATSIEALIAARFLQAVGGAGAMVLARAIVRDMFDGTRLARELSRMAAIMAIAPLIAPVIGGVLQTAFGWRSNFVALVCFSAVAWTMVWFLLPETLRQRTPEFSLSSTVRSFGDFLANRSFVVHLGIVACCLGGLFAWISTATFVLQSLYGLTALAFGLSFTFASAGYLVGASIAARFVTRWGSGRTMGLGAAAMALGGVVMMIHVAMGSHLGIALTLTAGLYMIGMGMALPQAQAGALLPFPNRAGAAASLVGFCSQTCSSLIGALLGHLLGDNAWPLAIAMSLAGALSVLLWWLSRGARAAANPH
jgi:MFS transporter, DHA1 family, multidrug resistance protein